VLNEPRIAERHGDPPSGKGGAHPIGERLVEVSKGRGHLAAIDLAASAATARWIDAERPKPVFRGSVHESPVRLKPDAPSRRIFT